MMKIRFLIGCGVMAILAWGSTFAAASDAGMEMDGDRQERILNRYLPGVENLASEEQSRLRGARDKALLTPEVQAALVDRNDTAKDFGGILQKALLKTNPKLAPLLEKLKGQNGRGFTQIAALAGGRAGKRIDPVLRDFTPEERQALLAAFRESRQEPEVSAARQRMSAAAQQSGKAIQAAMVKSDPAIQPLLGKLREGRRPLANRQLRAQ